MSPVVFTATTALLALVGHRLLTRDVARTRVRRDLAASPDRGSGLVATAGSAVGARLLAGHRRRRRRGQLAAALDTIGASLRAGRSLTDAIADAETVGAPLGPELAEIGQSTRRGAPLVEVLDRWAAGADGDTRTVAAALAVGSTVGGPIARAIDGAAQSLRERQALQQEAQSLATQARASAMVLSLAPVGVLSILGIADPTVVRFFTATRIGQGCLVVGLALDIAGAFWMRRMVRVAVDPPRPSVLT